MSWLSVGTSFAVLGAWLWAVPASAVRYGDFPFPAGEFIFNDVQDVNGLYGPSLPTVSFNSLGSLLLDARLEFTRHACDGPRLGLVDHVAVAVVVVPDVLL